MLFAVDIGNTNMEFGIFKEDKLAASFRLGTDRDITSDEVGLMIRQFFMIHQIDVEKLQDVIITSVVPQVEHSVKNAMRKYLSKEPLMVQENIAIPVVNHYENPAEVGADRLVNAYAGFLKYGGGLIIIDFGTATTFDVIDKEGAYLGGCIFPGIRVALNALVQNASKLPTVQIKAMDHVIGTNTVSSIQSGILYGYTGSVVHIIKTIERELGYPLRVIATGGLARTIGAQCDALEVIDRSLTMDGLYYTYQAYRKSREEE